MPTPLQGATFELRDQGGTVIATATSGADGIVTMGYVAPGTYTLVETQPPSGFIAGGPYTVVVSNTGDITVNGVPLSSFTAENYPYPSVTFAKTDAQDAPLQGATFELTDGFGGTWEATSTIDGTVTFYGIPPGSYELTETASPVGYLPDPSTHIVAVASDGTITIDGQPASGFSVINLVGPPLSFPKTDNTPQSAAPVINPVRAGLSPVTGTGIAGSDIVITWPDSTTTTVQVGLDNTWSAAPTTALAVGQTISAVQKTPTMLDSDPATAQVQETSAQPTIDEPVMAGAASVTGTGVANSIITVTWPDASTGTATVGSDGKWTISPSTALTFGQTLSATQTTASMLESLPVEATVQDVSPAPSIDPVTVGDSTITGTGTVDATINITWPDSSTATATVGPAATWMATPPSALTEGQQISATQTVQGMQPSTAVLATVQGISDPPIINPIRNGATTVEGTGVPGSTINLTWPDHTTETATVESDNTWQVTATAPLAAGQIVTATQTTSGKKVSAEATATVQEVSDKPTIDPLRLGYDLVTGRGIVGSAITVTFDNGVSEDGGVAVNGTWTIPVPVETPLAVGDTVTAVQRMAGKLPSDPVYEIVTS